MEAMRTNIVERLMAYSGKIAAPDEIMAFRVPDDLQERQSAGQLTALERQVHGP